MGRKASAALIRTGIVAALAISLASCGGSRSPAAGSTTSGGAGSTTAGQAPAHGIAVTPAAGRPTTTFSLRFTAPPSTRSEPNSRIGFGVALTTPTGTGCVGVRSLGAPVAPQGDPVTVTLDPARLGGRWCLGVHSVRVIETESPVCPLGTMCPQFVRVVRIIGTTTFRVTS